MKKTDLIVITSYPEKGQTHGSKTVGVASYTKNLLTGLKTVAPWNNTEVFAETFTGRVSSYNEKEAHVKRFWERKNIPSILRMFNKAAFSNTEKVLISFEMYMFGSMFHALLLWAGLIWMRILGKHTTVMLHQVVEDFKALEHNVVKASLLNIAKDFFYTGTLALSNKVIVFEEKLKQQLSNNAKIDVVPHLITPVSKPASKTKARKQLGWKQNKKYALYFGYLSPYKGVDWLIKNWSSDFGYELVVAGGMNTNHKGNKKIEKFVQNIYDVARAKGIEVTGFIPEDKVALYFAACDVVVLPYVMFMSSSGPLSLAMAYNKPVLLSRALTNYKHTYDFRKASMQSGLLFSQMSFDFNQMSLQRALQTIGRKKSQAVAFAKTMKQSRDISTIAMSLYESVYLKEQQKVSVSTRLAVQE